MEHYVQFFRGTMLARILITYLLLGFSALGASFLGYVDGVTLLTMGIAFIVLPAAALLALGAGMLDRWVEWERDVEYEARSSYGPASPEAAPARP